jgi:YidC/Oxa1 family membrane protein insertase
MVESARQAKILGVTIADKFLFSHGVPVHAKVVILAFVLISMATTYLTVRQSMKRGMMPAATPDNPMGQSQKYMMYIMPFFALSGLYWPFGLVLYWVTTNVWTLAQQWVLFRRYPQPAAAGAPAGGGTAPSPVIAPSAAGRNTTKPPKRAAAGQADQSGSNGSARKPANGGQPGNAGRKTSGAAASGTAGQGAQPSANGGGMLRRLGKRAEPEPPPAEPEVKLVRQQRQRQSRSKRSGKR